MYFKCYAHVVQTSLTHKLIADVIKVKAVNRNELLFDIYFDCLVYKAIERTMQPH